MSSESSAGDQTLVDYAPETKPDEDTRCIICPLETSKRKREYLRECVDEWQALSKHAVDRLRSFQPYRWTRNANSVGRIAKEWERETIKAALAQQAVYKPVEAFASWRDNGYPGDPPVGEFGSADYLRATQQQIQLEENDRGYGVKLEFVPYNPEWFHIDAGSYQKKWLARVLDQDNETRHGSGEVRFYDDETVALHLTVTRNVEVVKNDGVERWLGVDLNVDPLYATACVGVTSGDIENVELESGQEFRHYRDRLKEKQARLSEQGDLRGVRQCRGEIEKYTDQTFHTASKRIVELAADRYPCGIALEEMGDYRETAPDPNHGWPRGKFVGYIKYKARAEGIPVKTVDPSYTSQTCNRCGQLGVRDDVDFDCGRCDYHVHADVNAAINIATRAMES